MKKIIFGLFFLSSICVAADFTVKIKRPDGEATFKQNYRDMGDDTYSPTVFAEPSYEFSNISSTTTVKTTAGFLHLLTINTVAAQAFTVYDSTWTGDTSKPIASFASNSAIGSYFYDVQVTSGIVVVCPASGPNMTVSYR